MMHLVEVRMTRNVVTVRPADTLAAAASKMKAGPFRRLPVVEADQLVGIVNEITNPQIAGDSSFAYEGFNQ